MGAKPATGENMRMSRASRGDAEAGLAEGPGLAEAVGEILERLRSLEGPLLPILHAVQDRFGFIPADSVPLIAKGLNLSRAEVHGVISFYPLFRTGPPGKRTLYICRAEACQAMGGAVLEAHAKRALGIDYGGTTADGEFTLEPVFCLGNCACSPSVLLNGRLHSRVDPKAFDELIGR